MVEKFISLGTDKYSGGKVRSILQRVVTNPLNGSLIYSSRVYRLKKEEN